VIAPVMAVIVVLGFYPKPLLDAINPAVQQTNQVVRPHGDPTPSVPENSPTNASQLVYTDLGGLQNSGSAK
jgi:NADH-quinone oxidoreductase subunit M